MKNQLVCLLCVAGVGITTQSVFAQQPKRELAFETLSKQTNLQYVKKKEHVLRTQAEWEKLWKQMHQVEGQREQSSGRLPDLPKVDFTRQMVIAVFQGQKPSGGYSIEITKLVRNNGKLEVFVEETSPGKDCFTIQIITYPHHIVVVDKSTDPLRFTARQVTADCH